jgi:cell division protein FtsI (penicillin-binding protein 3)
MVDEPQGKHYGGEVAAPAFARIMADALRMYGIRPDAGVDSGVTIVSHTAGKETGA